MALKFTHHNSICTRPWRVRAPTDHLGGLRGAPECLLALHAQALALGDCFCQCGLRQSQLRLHALALRLQHVACLLCRVRPRLPLVHPCLGRSSSLPRRARLARGCLALGGGACGIVAGAFQVGAKLGLGLVQGMALVVRGSAVGRGRKLRAQSCKLLGAEARRSAWQGREEEKRHKWKVDRNEVVVAKMHITLMPTFCYVHSSFSTREKKGIGRMRQGGGPPGI